MEHPQSFDAYVASRGPTLLRYAHLLTGSAHDAEDLLQGALTDTYRHWRKVGTSNPDAYVRQALLNSYLNRRHRQRRPQRLMSRLPPVDPGFSVPERDEMWRALAALPARQRAVLVLRYYEDLDEASIARVMGVSPGTVKSQAAKALGALRRTHPRTEQEHGLDRR